MNTSKYISSDDVLSNVTALTADKDYKVLPKGFYMSIIQEAFEELNLDSYFQEMRADLELPSDSLIIDLPEGCFNVKNVYMFTGSECVVERSQKVWWKRNYFPKKQGYIANDKGNNGNDPYYGNRTAARANDKHLVGTNNDPGVNSVLFYNIQMGKLMLSSSCRRAGQKVHVHYNGTGGDISEAPIIPIFFREAIQDFVIEFVVRYRMANEPSDVRRWQAMYNVYAPKLDKEGFNGSWHKAIQRVKTMNSSQREELVEYLGRGQWANGF